MIEPLLLLKYLHIIRRAWSSHGNVHKSLFLSIFSQRWQTGEEIQGKGNKCLWKWASPIKTQVSHAYFVHQVCTHIRNDQLNIIINVNYGNLRVNHFIIFLCFTEILQCITINLWHLCNHTKHTINLIHCE